MIVPELLTALAISFVDTNYTGLCPPSRFLFFLRFLLPDPAKPKRPVHRRSMVAGSGTVSAAVDAAEYHC